MRAPSTGPEGKAPCRSAEHRRYSDGYKLAIEKLAKTTAVAEVIVNSLCELVAPRCGAGLPKGGGSIPAVSTCNLYALTVRAQKFGNAPRRGATKRAVPLFLLGNQPLCSTANL